jgi:hypothetical protein
MMEKVSELKYPEQLFVRKTKFLFWSLTIVQLWPGKIHDIENIRSID